jgi:cyclopropane fatty-acyl-phospholipid synthase-like methyltransferase
MLIAHKSLADTAAAFNRIYAGEERPPWDVDGPTPFVCDLAHSREIRGNVLDAGCGTGENALYLAAQGHHVVAVDAAPAAIQKATVKARQRGSDVRFMVADVRDLSELDGRFDTMIDAGLFHVMSKSTDRYRYANSLRRVARDGAMLHLLAFKNQGPVWLNRLRTLLRWHICGFGTHGVTKKEIQIAFSHGWDVEAVEERTYGWGTFHLARIRCV